MFCPRIATAPDLRDWTNMAATYDNLTNSVKSNLCCNLCMSVYMFSVNSKIIKILVFF